MASKIDLTLLSLMEETFIASKAATAPTTINHQIGSQRVSGINPIPIASTVWSYRDVLSAQFEIDFAALPFPDRTPTTKDVTSENLLYFGLELDAGAYGSLVVTGRTAGSAAPVAGILDVTVVEGGALWWVWPEAVAGAPSTLEVIRLDPVSPGESHPFVACLGFTNSV